jgi:hypothetical protein
VTVAVHGHLQARIDKVGAMRDDLLGEISLVISPDNAEFASVDIAIRDASKTWQNGIRSEFGGAGVSGA